jgi:predicted membrane protein
MKQSNVLVIFSGIFYVIMFYPESISSKFIFGGFVLGLLFSFYKYFLIKEFLNGEHEEYIKIIERLDKDEDRNQDSF